MTDAERTDELEALGLAVKAMYFSNVHVHAVHPGHVRIVVAKPGALTNYCIKISASRGEYLWQHQGLAWQRGVPDKGVCKTYDELLQKVIETVQLWPVH